MDLRQTVAQPKQTDIVGDIEPERHLVNFRSVHLTTSPNYFHRWVYANISATSRGIKYGNRRCKIKKAKSVFVDKMQFKTSSAKYRPFCSGPIVFTEAWSQISGHGDVINGNIFRLTGLFSGESTGHQGIPLTNASDAELWFFLSGPGQTVKQTIETKVTRHRAHYDVTIMATRSVKHGIKLHIHYTVEVLELINTFKFHYMMDLITYRCYDWS